jgi:hypothetical protein
MTISTFEVDPDRVRDDYFPHITAGFTADSPPTEETVTRWVTEAGAELEGRLLQKSINTEDITDADSSEYVWCAQTLTLMVAIRAARVMTGQSPEVVKAWQAELEARWEALSTDGEIALGMDTSGSDSEPEGPTDFISELGLDVGDTADASDVIPALRRSDEL